MVVWQQGSCAMCAVRHHLLSPTWQNLLHGHHANYDSRDVAVVCKTIKSVAAAQIALRLTLGSHKAINKQ